MRYGLNVLTEPSIEPVTLAGAKAHLRVTDDTDDELIHALIVAARRRAEAFCNRSFVSTVWTMTMDGFPGTILLPRSPAISVDEIRYVDGAGATQVLAPSKYRADLTGRPGRIVPAYGDAWPTTRPIIASVSVDFSAGWGATADSVPQDIRQAIKILIATFYENAESIVVGTITAKVPMSAEFLLGPYRTWP